MKKDKPKPLSSKPFPTFFLSSPLKHISTFKTKKIN